MFDEDDVAGSRGVNTQFPPPLVSNDNVSDLCPRFGAYCANVLVAESVLLNEWLHASTSDRRGRGFFEIVDVQLCLV